MGAKHEALLKRTALAIQKNFPLSRFIPRHVGLFFTKDQRPVMIGMRGQADAYVLLPYKGDLIHIELEFKQGADRQSQHQKNWQNVIESMGGMYLIVKDENVAVSEIKNRFLE